MKFYDQLVADCMNGLPYKLFIVFHWARNRLMVGVVDTMSSGSIGLRWPLYLLPLGIVSTNPTPIIIEEHIPYPMKNIYIRLSVSH